VYSRWYLEFNIYGAFGYFRRAFLPHYLGFPASTGRLYILFSIQLYLYSYFVLDYALIIVCGQVSRIVHVYACDEYLHYDCLFPVHIPCLRCILFLLLYMRGGPFMIV